MFYPILLGSLMYGWRRVRKLQPVGLNIMGKVSDALSPGIAWCNGLKTNQLSKSQCNVFAMRISKIMGESAVPSGGGVQIQQSAQVTDPTPHGDIRRELYNPSSRRRRPQS